MRRQRVQRPRPRRDDDDPGPVPLERRRDPGPHDRGLAGPGRADDGQHPGAGEPAQAIGHGRVPAEERLGVADVVGNQPHVGTHRARLRRLVGDQRRVLAQDRLLQRHQVGARVQAQLLGQDPAGPVEGAQRLALPARLVLGQRQEHPPVLTQRFLGHPRLRLGEDRSGSARQSHRVQAQLLGLQPELFQPRGLDPSRLPPVEVDQCPSPPQTQRLAHHVGRPIGLAQRQQLPGASQVPLEPARVDLVGRQHEAVPVRPGLDRGRTQRLAQLHQASLQRLRPRRRHLLAPPGVGQRLRGHDLTPAHGQRREHHLLTRRQPAPVAVHRQWAQDPDPPRHAVSVHPGTGPVNWAVTTPLPA